MLTGIEIENYRGIRKASITEFGSINLLVGPNGSGKSTLLEAIFLGAYGKSRDFVFRGLSQNNALALIALRHNEDRFPSPEMRFRKELTNRLSISYKFGDKSTAFIINGSGAGSDAPAREPVSDDSSPFFTGMKLLDARVLLDQSYEIQTWDEILNVRGDRELVRTLNEVYGVQIESLTYSAHGHKLKVLFSDRDYALSLDDLGAGLRISFRVFIAVLHSQGSAVLAEEFDAYQHVSVFRSFVRALIGLSRRSNVQLFLATHRMEAVRTFLAEALSPRPATDLKIFQTSLTKDGLLETTSFTAKEAQALLTGGFDLRSAP